MWIRIDRMQIADPDPQNLVDADPDPGQKNTKFINLSQEEKKYFQICTLTFRH